MRTRNTTSVAAALLCVWALTANLSAQRAVPRGGSSGGSSSGGHSSGGGSGGGGSTSSGGSSGGGTSSGGSSGGGQKSGGAVQRAPARGGDTSTKGGTVVARTAEPSSGNTRDTASSTPARSDDENDPAPTTRTRQGAPTYGKAVPRKGAPPPLDHDWDPGDYYGGYYPWGWSGIGFGGYYGGYYDPWYYGGYGYPTYSGSYNDYDGTLRLKMKPREAQVFADGYFMGVVDDFDGMWQRLHLQPGPHRIEVRGEGYETLMFEVNLQPDKTITYTGELKKLIE